MKFKNYTGKTVLHCHILNHEDAGMMAVLQIDK
jgi:FtsP/CotA-like multicopper oxidase with cupredoxin domain